MQNDDKKIEMIVTEKNPSNIKDFFSQIIPLSIQLGGLTIDVLFQEKLAKNDGMIGVADYALQQIRLDPTITTKQTTEQAYFHELTRWILFMMDERELCNNEKFVDVFAHFLYQALTSAEPYPQPSTEAEAIHDEEYFSCGRSLEDEEICEALDYAEPHEYQQGPDPVEFEEEQEHLLACWEAGMEDVDSYQEGIALSDDEGWFYGDEG